MLAVVLEVNAEVPSPSSTPCAVYVELNVTPLTLPSVTAPVEPTELTSPDSVFQVGAAPVWASIDLPVPQGPLLGIVPSTWDDRFAAQFDAACTVGSGFVRRTVGVEAIERVAADRLGLADGPLAGAGWADDFRALGIAALLATVVLVLGAFQS